MSKDNKKTEQEYLNAKQIVQEYEKQLNISGVINSQKPIEEILSDAIKQSYDKIKDNLEPPL
jgi:phosphoribosylformimino-5-aminoimidazole carboxamide ribonucleotide (ProFAR) isomerase